MISYNPDERSVGRPRSNDVRERRIKCLLGLCQGKTVKEIADEMDVDVDVVTTDLTRLRKQENVRNNIQLVARIVFGMRG